MSKYYDSSYSILLDMLKMRDGDVNLLQGISDKLDNLNQQNTGCSCEHNTLDLDLLKEILKENTNHEKETIIKETIIEKPVEKIVVQEKIVEKPVIKEKVVVKENVIVKEKPVEKVIYKDKVRVIEKAVHQIVVKYINNGSNNSSTLGNNKQYTTHQISSGYYSCDGTKRDYKTTVIPKGEIITYTCKKEIISKCAGRTLYRRVC